MITFRSKIVVALSCLIAFGVQSRAASQPHAATFSPIPAAAEQVEAGKYAQASEILKETLVKDPGNAQANLLLARCFLELGDYDQAITYAGRAVKLNPNSSEFHLWLGRAVGLKAEKDQSFLLARKSRQEFQTAVQLDPNNLQAHRDLIEFYLQAPWILGGSKDKAWQEVEVIASRDAVAGHLARAAYWQETSRPDLAKQEYQQLMKLKPGRVSPYFEIADFYESSGNAEQMEAVVHAASLIEPGDPRLAYYRGVAKVIEGRELPEAEQYLKTYLVRSPQREDFPSHAAAHNWLGRLYERWGKIKDAIQQYQAALRLSPKNQTAQKELQRLEVN